MITLEEIINSKWLNMKVLIKFLLGQMIIIYGLIGIAIWYKKIELLEPIAYLSIISSGCLLILLYIIIRLEHKKDITTNNKMSNKVKILYLLIGIIIILMSLIFMMINNKAIYIIDNVNDTNENQKPLIWKDYHPDQDDLIDKEFQRKLIQRIEIKVNQDIQKQKGYKDKILYKIIVDTTQDLYKLFYYKDLKVLEHIDLSNIVYKELVYVKLKDGHSVDVGYIDNEFKFISTFR